MSVIEVLDVYREIVLNGGWDLVENVTLMSTRCKSTQRCSCEIFEIDKVFSGAHAQVELKSTNGTLQNAHGNTTYSVPSVMLRQPRKFNPCPFHHAFPDRTDFVRQVLWGKRPFVQYAGE